jgi:hydroxymethylglutaryl-CoA synthase
MMNLQSASNPSIQVGIDDMALYVPDLYLPMDAFATARHQDYGKLSKGLGLEQMACSDRNEDVATLMANAVAQLIERNQLDPRQIGRIYLGTESSFDGAKPMASYALGMLEQRFSTHYGAGCLRHCDAVDMTFACIGAVDALQNTLDWVRANPSRIGIVVAADIARYDLESPGEYTQGAGAVALLVKAQPRLVAIEPEWGVATESVHDFFKPMRKMEVEGLSQMLEEDDVQIYQHKDTPVFDGPFSNASYQNRIREAYHNFIQQQRHNTHSDLGNWDRLVPHLPYAFHGKRMFGELFLTHLATDGKAEQWLATNHLTGPEAPTGSALWRAVTKTDDYRSFAREKVEKAQRFSSRVGNIYAASVFLALMSTLETDFLEEESLEGRTIGFFAYGSGSKSKVFSGEVQPQWKNVVSQWKTHERLNDRQAIDFETYLSLHRKEPGAPVATHPTGHFFLEEVDWKGSLPGKRTYHCKALSKSPEPKVPVNANNW